MTYYAIRDKKTKKLWMWSWSEVLLVTSRNAAEQMRKFHCQSPEKYEVVKVTVKYEVNELTNTERVAEVERLTAECFALAAHQCKYPSGDDYGNPVCEEVERLRQELATAEASARDFEAVCMSQEGQIARLIQEIATAKAEGAAEDDEELRIFRATRQQERKGIK